MIEKTIERLYPLRGVGNVADVRDYTARKAVDTNQSVKLNLENTNQFMILTPEDLKTKFVGPRKGPFKSKKKPGSTYYIIPYLWIPNTI